MLNELLHRLVIGEVAQRGNLKPGQVVEYLKRHRDVLKTLEAYEVIAEVESSYGLTVLGISAETFKAARQLMQLYQLLSNDALHLAVMREVGVRDLVTADTDFDRVAEIRVWKPLDSCSLP